MVRLLLRDVICSERVKIRHVTKQNLPQFTACAKNKVTDSAKNRTLPSLLRAEIKCP